MKLPRSILLNLKISAAKAEHERENINFYPKWILPLKLVFVFASIFYFYLILFYLNPLSNENYHLIMNLLLLLGAVLITLTALKTLAFTFLRYLNISGNQSERNSESVTIIIKLSKDKYLNMQTINSVIDQNHKNIEVILLSNIKNKYSDFDKSILKDNGNERSGIKVSLLYSSDKSEIELLNAAIKIASAKLIAVLKSNSIIEKNAIVNAVKHLKDEKISGVIGRSIEKSELSFSSVNEILDGLKFNAGKEYFVNSSGVFLFRKAELSSVKFISLGSSKTPNIIVKQSANDKKFIYDPTVKSNLVPNENKINPIFKILELNLLRIDTILQQWNYFYLKGGSITERFRLNWQLLKVTILPLVCILYSLVFIFTATASNNFEYIFLMALFLIVTNFFVSIITIAIDFSLSKYILQSIFTKWFTDYLASLLKVFNTGKNVINSRLHYTVMSK